MGRHKMSRKTIEQVERDIDRIERVGKLWDRYYTTAITAGTKQRAAHKEATDAVAGREGLTPRRVQQLLREARERQSHHDLLRRALENGSRRDGVWRRAAKLLTDEQWKWIQRMPFQVADPLLRAVVEGAAALEENKRLRARDMVSRDFRHNSAKPNRG